ncbi:small GTP-binding protein, putative [Trichomonas vaginalis G3]|uniref:Small GTP-binding protein, putative n=2 Tax=Trichomonas vaginalis TaxID=5722 RepID=A0A8U0WPT7_TRIV3|nr:small Rab GTPase Rab6b [Trichomonas vaginalis G3]AAX97452.1 small Rab GTPase Rab6b [Trichomonas vaginalis]EAX88882.1 small GTP-binding protein, putative [Trichomonas vaginalis G3]KAI5508542.1 small Rab GTPase Rab6b [Trichomonas vaginalis G3]|eukprot:XP_001301812.1 small GTP-binding protein [Trichomonas vaginalis G3]
MSTKCKVVFLGSAGVGKTSLLNRLMTDEFSNQYNTTIGVDFFTKPVQVQGRTVTLQIWDTAGQERFKSLMPSYIRDSSVAVIVYDVSDEKSFDEAQEWYETVMHERGNEAKCVLVGNKIDLERRVDLKHVDDFAKPRQMQTIETSAKTSSGVARLFKLISELAPDVTKIPQVYVLPIEPKPIEQNREGCQC